MLPDCLTRSKVLLFVLLSQSLLSFATAIADDPTEKIASGTKRAILLCGHPGDDDHRKLFGESITKIHQGLTMRLGYRVEDIATFFGVEPTDDNSSLGVEVKGPGTREAFAAEVATIREQLQPDDSLWVIVLGHAHYDNRRSWLNLPGPDINQDDFAKLFQGLTCRDQVFVLTTPASGFYIKPLSAKGRIVITATEADLEVNETIFHLALADELNPSADKMPVDADEDGRQTLFDFYIALARNVAQRYVKDELLSTEHALLDDNGDGRGTELQLNYLTEEEGGRKRRDFKPSLKSGADGSLSATRNWKLAQP